MIGEVRAIVEELQGKLPGKCIAAAKFEE